MDEGVFKFSMEYKDALIEIAVPDSAVPDEFLRKEWLQNTAVDMYARMRVMIANMEARDAGD